MKAGFYNEIFILNLNGTAFPYLPPPHNNRWTRMIYDFMMR